MKKPGLLGKKNEAWKMLPISFPVFIAGLITCYLVERFSLFSFGVQLPSHIRQILYDFDKQESLERTDSQNMKIVTQAIVALVLVFSLAFGLAAVGLIGLMIIVLLTAFNGVIEEPKLGKAFEEALRSATLSQDAGSELLERCKTLVKKNSRLR